MIRDVVGTPLKEGQRIALLPQGPLFGVVADVSKMLMPEGEVPAGATKLVMRFELTMFLKPNASIGNVIAIATPEDELPGEESRARPQLVERIPS